jgi:hypothetical protein
MNRFYVLALICVLVVPLLFLVFPSAYALVYAVFPIMLAIIFASVPRVWDYFTDGGRPPSQDRTGMPLGYIMAIVLLIAWPALMFFFPSNSIAAMLSVLALVLAGVSAGISDFIHRRRRND